jgi:hypothetical protein
VTPYDDRRLHHARRAQLLPGSPRSSRGPLAALGLVALIAAAAGCESEKAGNATLARELDKICHAVERAGAAAEPEPANQMAMVAMWLDQNVKSDEGLAFLRAFSRLGEDKAARRTMLEDAARAAGIRDCPLLAFWK